MTPQDIERIKVTFDAASAAASAIVSIAGAPEAVPAIAAAAGLLNALAPLIEAHMKSHPQTIAAVDAEVDAAIAAKFPGQP